MHCVKLTTNSTNETTAHSCSTLHVNSTSTLGFIFFITETMKSCDLLAAQRVQVGDSTGATYPAAQGVGEEVPFPLQALPSGHDEQVLAPKKLNKIFGDE